jgi:hypothetical protein
VKVTRSWLAATCWSPTFTVMWNQGPVGSIKGDCAANVKAGADAVCVWRLTGVVAEDRPLPRARKASTDTAEVQRAVRAQRIVTGRG